MIVKGEPNPDFNQESVVFGSFALFYKVTTNGMNRRIIPPITINESNNHGGHYFMSLYTGKILYSHEWKQLPIENDVIEQVKQFSSDEEVKLTKDRYPTFEWAPDIPIIDKTQEEA